MPFTSTSTTLKSGIHNRNYNSLIFKTINSSVDETRQTLALFNKDWDTYKRNWQNADDFRSKLKSVISSNDVNCIKAFNTQLSNGIKPSEAYKNTMVNCSKAAKQEAVAIAKGNSTLQEAEQVINSAQNSTIGLLNDAPFLAGHSTTIFSKKFY